MMVMGRLVDKSSFGIFALASVVIAMTQIFAEFGFGPALVQKDNIRQEHINFAFLGATGVGLLLMLGLVLSSYFISAFYEGKVSAEMIQVMSLNLVFSTLGSASRSLLIRELKFDKLFWANGLSYVIGNLIIGIYLAWQGYEEWALIVGLLAGNLLASLFYLIFRPLNFRFSFTKENTKDILHYGVGLTGVQLFSQLAHQVDKLLLGKVLPLDFLGSFERAQRIQGMPLMYAGKSIDGILFSLMSKLNNEKSRLQGFYFPFLSMIAIGMIYLSVIVFFFAGDIIRFLLGPGWDQAISIIKVMTCLIFIQTFSRFGDTFIRATRAFKVSSIVKILFLLSIVFFIPLGYWLHGIYGAIGGIVLANVVHAVSMLVTCIRLGDYSIKQFIWLLLPVLVLGILLIIKNTILFRFLPNDFPIKVLTVGFTDLLLFLGYYKYPSMIGKNNAEFISRMLKDTRPISKIISWLDVIVKKNRR